MSAIKFWVSVDQNRAALEIERRAVEKGGNDAIVSSMVGMSRPDGLRVLACLGWKKLKAMETTAVRRMHEDIERENRPNKSIVVKLTPECAPLVSEALTTFDFLNGDRAKAIRLAVFAAR